MKEHVISSSPLRSWRALKSNGMFFSPRSSPQYIAAILDHLEHSYASDAEKTVTFVLKIFGKLEQCMEAETIPSAMAGQV